MDVKSNSTAIKCSDKKHYEMLFVKQWFCTEIHKLINLHNIGKKYQRPLKNDFTLPFFSYFCLLFIEIFFPFPFLFFLYYSSYSLSESSESLSKSSLFYSYFPYQFKALDWDYSCLSSYYYIFIYSYPFAQKFALFFTKSFIS